MVEQNPEPEERGPLPDDAIVVRGGLMCSETLDDNIRSHERLYPDDPPTLSVAAHSTWDLATIASAALFIPHPRICVSTAGAIRALGHDVVPSGREPHCNLQLCAPGSDLLYTDLRAAFSEPMDNPRLNP